MNNPKVRVKICGIKDLDTGRYAVKCGADALGFVFASSSRQVTPEQARSIIFNLPPFISKVGVFVNAPKEKVQQIARECRLDYVQLHGDETPEYAKEIGIPVIKAFRVRDAEVLQQAAEYPADAVLLDAYTPGVAGGTGKTFNWHLLKKAQLRTPLILAGGLTAENITEAIQIVHPYALDVSSGVETEGKKDLQKIAMFMSRVEKGVS
ncbi:MAG: phosphoribosylanthranilate isomerase [Firmicutes bacterium]|nr:phosphoribosylanthranilate isomerase [Bacillota bacterium]